MFSDFANSVRSRAPRLLGERGPLVPVVRLAGMIGRVARFRTGISLEAVAAPLKKAFSTKSAPAVALIVDSPGGSPVQSHLIYRRIRSLAEEHEKPVYVFVEDVCASGGYMIACAGDEIVVDPASIVGSIGVVSAGFGFPEAISKLGIERRVYTTGANKMILDPFRPEKESDVAHLKSLQEDVHALFVDLVKERRGSVLSSDPELFSGLFWSGQTALGLGLADRVGDLRTVLREKFGQKVRMKMIGGGRALFTRRAFGLDGVGAALAETVMAELEERFARGRFGR